MAVIPMALEQYTFGPMASNKLVSFPMVLLELKNATLATQLSHRYQLDSKTVDISTPYRRMLEIKLGDDPKVDDWLSYSTGLSGNLSHLHKKKFELQIGLFKRTTVGNYENDCSLRNKEVKKTSWWRAKLDPLWEDTRAAFDV